MQAQREQKHVHHSRLVHHAVRKATLTRSSAWRYRWPWRACSSRSMALAASLPHTRPRTRQRAHDLCSRCDVRGVSRATPNGSAHRTVQRMGTVLQLGLACVHNTVILSCHGRDRPISLCARVRLLVLVLVVKVLAVEEEVGLVSPSPGTSRHLPHRGSRHKLMSGAKNESALRDVLDRPEAYLLKKDERGRRRVKPHSVSNPHRAELQGAHK